VWKRTEPYQFNFTVPGMNVTYTDLIRTAIQQRYSLVRYIYSSFHGIGQFGGSFFKPLFYEFQDELNVFDDDSTQVNIQLGHALKLSI
jgi:alpha-glucosidase (family GH31 glycosyl hydrolase)